ncbi:hypothetical protein V6Z11_D07G179200 [Gossypium hirsutum]
MGVLVCGADRVRRKWGREISHRDEEEMMRTDNQRKQWEMGGEISRTAEERLIWKVVKKNNCFLVRQFGRGTTSFQFSKEPNNLYNLHSYKHSRLANKKTVTIQSGGKDQSVLLATTKPKKQNKPSALLHKSLMKKEFARMAKAVKNEVTDNYYRPDLTKTALARLSAVHRSLKVAKSSVKKRNRQALKVRGRK